MWLGGWGLSSTRLWEANSSTLEDHLLLSKDFFFFLSPVGCQRLERKRSHLFIYLFIVLYIPYQASERCVSL